MSLRPRRSRVSSSYSNQSSVSVDSAVLPRRHRPDYWILILTSLLIVIGFVVVYSISPGLAASQQVSQNHFITKQFIDIGLGVAAFSIAALLPLLGWKKLAKPLIVAALVGSAIVMVTPLNEYYPAHRWIRFGGFSFQIVELIKLALIIGLAGFLARQWRADKLSDFKATFRPLFFLVLLVGLIVAKFQSDLGSAAVIVAIVGLMAFSIGIPLKKIALISVAILLLAGLAIATSDYRRDRVSSFLNPDKNCEGTSYQACQALISVGSGGVLGLGLGFGVQAYGYLPQPSNDSIFAIMAEKFGFIGSALVIVIYGLLIARLKRVIERSADQFSRLLVVGVLAWLSTQMIINIGAMLGLLPLKGITLPLISQGGTSLVFLAVALGIVFQISRYTSYNVTEPKNTFKSTNDDSLNRRGNRRTYSPPIAARPRT